MKAPNGEVDAVAALRPEDIPLVRRARRASISRFNQHAMIDYASFAQILWSLEICERDALNRYVLTAIARVFLFTRHSFSAISRA